MSKDLWGGDSLQPQTLNGWGYAKGNPVILTDPSGYCSPLDNNRSFNFALDDCIVGAQELDSLYLGPRVRATVFYLNQIGNIGGNAFQPNPDPNDEQGYILYRVGQVVGPENVRSIPVYKGSVFMTRLQMFAEMYECRIWSPVVANEITRDIKADPLLSGEQLIIIGNSGGGTLAIEALDLLEEQGIFVDHVILRGSPVREWTLTNVGRVDYITSNFDYYYSFDVNPFDDVTVQEHRIDFWGHVPPDADTIKQIADLIVELITQ